MKFKSLILKFGLDALMDTCERRGWRIPSRDELLSAPTDSMHRLVWVSDVPPKVEDKKTHAMLFDIVKDTMEVVNKSHKHNAVVIVEEKFCTWTMSHRAEPTCEIGCTVGSEFSTLKEAKKFNVCPYCGNKILIKERLK